MNQERRVGLAEEAIPAMREHFQEKLEPAFTPKVRQKKQLERRSNSIGTEKALRAADCRTCGACCSFSRDWPRFTLETDADIDLIPHEFVDETLSRMRCHDDRCSALIGDVGISTSCGVYSQRPEVCRACEPGDDACRIARRHFGIDAGRVR